MSYLYDDPERKGGNLAPVRPRTDIPWGSETLTPERSRLSVDHDAVVAAPELFEPVSEPVPGQDPSVARDRADRTRSRLIGMLDAQARAIRRGGRTRGRSSRSRRHPRPLRLP